jgi:hypothetical protein
MKNNAGILAIGMATLLVSTAVTHSYPVTFQVNMDYQINNASPSFDAVNDTIEVKGSFNGWGSGVSLSNMVGTFLYTNTIDVPNSAGSLVQYKFHAYGPSYAPSDNWESLPGYIYTNGDNRAFVLSGSPQILPPAYFSDQWGGQVPLTFQVDMGPQVFAGNFVPGVNTVEVRGSWDGFSSGVALTNNPTGASSNLYSMTFTVSSPAPGGLAAYKFHIWGGPDYYEPDPNRLILVTSPATTAPSVYFSNLETNDLLPQATYITFAVDMNGAVGIDAHPFDPSTDAVYINGAFANWNNNIGTWYPWGIQFDAPFADQMIEQGASTIYTNTILMPKGSPVEILYKYGMDIGSHNSPADDEAGFIVNHLRYVRTAGSYSMPQDIFGGMTNEISFGNLHIGGPFGGKSPVTWLGRPGVHLQASTSLTSSSWLDLWATDSLGSTNYPIGTASGFFRLVKP